MALSVVLSTAGLAVDPGGSVHAEARLSTDGPDVQRVRLQVRGPAQPWSWVVPLETAVGPGADGVVSVGFRVPKASEPPAGSLAFEVVAVSAEDGSDLGRAGGTVMVTPFTALSVEVDPEETAGAGPTEHQVAVFNLGNVAVQAAMGATTPDGGLGLDLADPVLDLAPGERGTTTLTVRPADRPLRGSRTLVFSVSAKAGDQDPVWAAGRVRQAPRLTDAMVRIAVVVALLAVTVGVGAVALSGGGESEVSATEAGSTTTVAASPACPVDGHIDGRVTGLTPDRIPTLPKEYSFFNASSDGCNPVRWNPCEDVHYVINPASAPPTGVADVRAAFEMLGEATGMTYVDDGMTDETGIVAPPPGPPGAPGAAGGGRYARAYQPDRYGERWAPILVRWQSNNRETDGVQIVGSGFPTRSGDVYITGALTLNPNAHTDEAGKNPVEGGFGSSVGFGPIGPTGVTWGRIILHELAHIMGMGHVSDQGQLMYPETALHTGRPARFAAGDLAGLKLMGREAGCLTTPAPGSAVRGI